PKSGCSGFAINLGHSENDVALHFNPRFDAHGDLRTIVMNSRQGGAWGSEQRESSFPFQQGEEFKVYITHNNDSFEVKLSDGSVIHFPNRLGDDQFLYMQLEGEVQLVSIHIK
ncbi:LEG protein, partial [Amia calva]|nr:LEG protein [Amia calva]